MPPRILVVEDEPEMLVILRDNLECEGYTVTSAESGEKALQEARDHPPDLIVLDLMLPGMSGYEVCKKLRELGVSAPIVMVSARNAEIDRVAGLEIGADDYVGKPFGVRELLARLRVQLRRAESSGMVDEFAFGNLVVSFSQFRVRRGGAVVDLSTREFELLRYFIVHRSEAISRERLLRDVWGYDGRSMTRTIDTFVLRLRRKIEPNPLEPQYIRTVHGTGYRFVV